MIKSTKIQAGEYEIEYKNRKFHLARVNVITEGENTSTQWQLCELKKYSQEYWNHFVTKSDAIRGITETLDNE